MAHAPGLERVPLPVDPDLVGGKSICIIAFPLRLLRGTLREEAGAELVGLVVRVVGVVLPRGEVRAAFDELCYCGVRELRRGEERDGGGGARTSSWTYSGLLRRTTWFVPSLRWTMSPGSLGVNL